MVVTKKIILITFIIIAIISTVFFVLYKNAPQKLTYTILQNKLHINSFATLNYKIPVTLLASNNFFEAQKIFKITKDTFINIYAIGEGGNTLTNPMLFKSLNNDGLEVFFDMKNEKLPSFNIETDDRQYRILWGLLSIDGRNINTKGVTVSQKDSTKSTYTMVINFPWHSLGYVEPKIGVVIGFDIALLDRNPKGIESLLNWHSNNSDTWQNTRYYGTLRLTKFNNIKSNDSTVNCVYTSQKPNNTNNLDPIWSKTTQYKFNNVTLNTVKDSLDLSGNFKALWDKENLYLLVNVRDDVKEYENTMFDYGWIEDMKGKIIWQMAMPQTTHAGGALKNRHINNTIKIKKGNYVLKYKTDESHSPAQWDDKPPISSFYGIKIKYAQ